jgi:hypothetical protein
MRALGVEMDDVVTFIPDQPPDCRDAPEIKVVSNDQRQRSNLELLTPLK